MAKKKELFPPNDEDVQSIFYVYNFLKQIFNYSGSEKKRTADRRPQLTWPEKEIDRIEKIMEDMERRGWLEETAAAKLTEQIIYKVHLSPNSRIFILQDGRRKKDLPSDFLIYSLVDSAKRKTGGKPSFSQVAHLLNKHGDGFQTYTYHDIRKRYERVRERELYSLLSHIGLIDADNDHAIKHISRILDIITPKKVTS